MPEWISALILGVVEGATEFIPVSSTGHLILVGHWLGFVGLRADVFEVVIQFGAILAVVWQFRSMLARLVRDVVHDPDARQTAFKVVVAISPAMAVGLLAHRWINGHLFRPQTVAWALLVGGVGILLVERTRPLASVRTVSEMSMMTALGIGVAQVLSLFPGVSRSAATIMGGIALGVDRSAATEFSFLLAIPVMFAATALDLISYHGALAAKDLPIFGLGIVTAFVAGLIVIRVLLRFVVHHTFSGFGWYRIALGVILLAVVARAG